jgi:hypothetical protein
VGAGSGRTQAVVGRDTRRATIQAASLPADQQEVKLLLTIICSIFASGLGASLPVFWNETAFTTQSLYYGPIGAWVGRWVGAQVSF